MTELEKQQRIGDIKRSIERLKEEQTHLPPESDHFFINAEEIKKLDKELNNLAGGANNI